MRANIKKSFMKNITKYIGILLLLSLVACNEKDTPGYATHNLPDTDIHTLNLDVNSNVSISFGDESSISINGTEEKGDLINYYVSDGKLIVNNSATNDVSDLYIEIILGHIDSINVSNQTNLVLKKVTSTDPLIINLSDNSNAEIINSNFKNLHLYLKENANVEISDLRGENLFIHASDNNNINISDININNTTISSHQSSDIIAKNIESISFNVETSGISDAIIETLISDTTITKNSEAANIIIKNSTSTYISIDQKDEARFAGETMTITEGRLINNSSNSINLRVKNKNKISTQGLNINLFKI